MMRVFSAAIAIAIVAGLGFRAHAAEPVPATSSATPCPAVVPSPEPAPLAIGDASWLVSVTTTGGMSGFGHGRFSVRSDGTLWRDGCTARLGTVDLSTLAGVVGSTREQRWAHAYRRRGDGCCDQLYATVVIERRTGRGIRRQESSTSSVAFDDAPADYRRLYAALDAMTEPYGLMARRSRP